MPEEPLLPLRSGSRDLSLWALAVALIVGFLLRLGTWPQVFLAGRVWIDGPDGYYHLRRAWLTLKDWPWTPQTDGLIGVPEGGPISWPPLFDWLLATLAAPWGGDAPESLELVGAWLPPVLGLVEIILLFWVVRRAFGPSAAGWSALFAAVLPGVARYSLLGALDHDPLVESVFLLAVGGVVGALCRGRPTPSDIAVASAGVTLLVLSWAGSILHLGLLCGVVLVVELLGDRSDGSEPAASVVLGWSFLIAAVATLPFVLTSVWTSTYGASFVGLSWLHTAVLMSGACVGLGLAWWRAPARSKRPGWLGHGRAIAAVSCVGALLLLAPVVWPAFRDGLVFFGRGEPFLRGVAESRPLLSLFGSLDARPLIVRLSMIPLVLPFLLAWAIWKTRWNRSVLFFGAWSVGTLALALVQSRYAHAAAMPMAAVGGVLASNALGWVQPGRARLLQVAAAVLVLLPSIPAYVSAPGFAPYRFYGRLPQLATTGMSEVCDYLRDNVPPSEAWADPSAESTSSVLAPWSSGHWLMWSGRQGTVMTPLGPQGQRAFADGIRFYLARDPREARDLLARHRVRHVVTLAEIPPLDSYLELGGVERNVFFGDSRGSNAGLLKADVYLATIAARLTWMGAEQVELFGAPLAALDGYEEVFRTSRTRPTPFPGITPEAEIPLARIYRVSRKEG